MNESIAAQDDVVQRLTFTGNGREYFRRHCWVSVEPDEALAAQTIVTLGDDNIVISSDWPHDDSAYPRATDSFLELEGVSKDSKRKILWDNCARLYRL